MSQSIAWHEDENGIAVITPMPGQKLKIEVPPKTHFAGPSKDADNTIEINPK